MEAQLKKTSELDLDLNLFYAIRIYSDRIHLQGNCTRFAKRECEMKGFKFELQDDFLVAKNNGFEITLTLDF